MPEALRQNYIVCVVTTDLGRDIPQLRLIRADLLRPSVAKWKSDMLGKPGVAIDTQFVIDEIRRMRDTAK